jgi:hypothetical protein
MPNMKEIRGMARQGIARTEKAELIRAIQRAEETDCFGTATEESATRRSALAEDCFRDSVAEEIR